MQCSLCRVCTAVQCVQRSAVRWSVMQDNLAKSSLSKEQCGWAAGDISFPYLAYSAALLCGFVYLLFCICIFMFFNVFVHVQKVCEQRGTASDISFPYLTYTALLSGFVHICICNFFSYSPCKSIYLYPYTAMCICISMLINVQCRKSMQNQISVPYLTYTGLLHGFVYFNIS